MTAFVAALLIKLTLVLTAGLVITAISRSLSPSVPPHLRATPARDVDVAELECSGVATRIFNCALVRE